MPEFRLSGYLEEINRCAVNFQRQTDQAGKERFGIVYAGPLADDLATKAALVDAEPLGDISEPVTGGGHA